MAKSTFQGVLRSGPKGAASSVGHAGTAVLALHISFDPTAANTTGTGVYLPEGAVVLGFQHDGGATGGTSPTFDLGITGTAGGLINEGAADAAGYVAANGSLVDTATSSAVELIAGVGASAATGGTIAGYVLYIRQDSTSGLNE